MYSKIPLELINIEKTIQSNETNFDEILEEFYKKNLEKYMSEEKRDVEYIIVNKNNFVDDFVTSDFEISEYYNNNNDLMAVAKLARPLKKPTDLPITFKVQIDI